MPVCKQCQQSSNCLRVDFCVHCGATDWAGPPIVLSGSYVERLVPIAAIVLIVLGMAAGIAGLLSFFALMHRMWNHS